MLCALILYMSGGLYYLNSTPNDRFLRIFSWQFYLLSEILPEICWEEIAEEIYFFFLYFIFNDWPGIRTQASNKPAHYIPDHSDFNIRNSRNLKLTIIFGLHLVYRSLVNNKIFFYIFSFTFVNYIRFFSPFICRLLIKK